MAGPSGSVWNTPWSAGGAFTERVSVTRPVLIVGAGSTGLTAALELARFGIGVRIIDKLAAPSAAPWPVPLHPWTLELLEQRGLSPELLPASRRVTRAAIYGGNGLLGQVGLTRDTGHRRHLLLACQAELERMLREELARQGVMVGYATEMIALTQAEPGIRSGPDGPSVTPVLRHRDGRQEECAASYLISADGSHSTAGHLLKLPVPDEPDGQPYMLADLRLDGDLCGDMISVCLGRDGFALLLPRGGGWFRFVATDPRPGPGDACSPGMPELRQLAGRFLPSSARVQEMQPGSPVPGQPAGDPRTAARACPSSAGTLPTPIAPLPARA